LNLSAFEHLIFDYDNTIAKVPIDWKMARANFRKFLTAKFQGIELEQDIRVDEMEKIALSMHPNQKDDIFSFRYLLEKSLDGRHEPNVKVIDILRKCEQGPFQIISNNLKSTVCSGLSQFKISHLFDIVIGVDDAECPKPSTKAWDILLSSKKINHKSCLFIGDSKSTDGKFAQSVGIPFMNVSNLIYAKK
jgi:FMN phosphatase YigB (HAD superfamily)